VVNFSLVTRSGTRQFGCCAPQVCHKQYKNAAELETHLSSYDHHHKKARAQTRPQCVFRIGMTACAELLLAHAA